VSGFCCMGVSDAYFYEFFGSSQFLANSRLGAVVLL
jgi:hypothetical protein